jgi:hypothetical protein
VIPRPAIFEEYRRSGDWRLVQRRLMPVRLTDG